MYPILLEIGPIIVYSLWIFIAIGFFTALIIINKLALKTRLKLAFITEHSLSIFFSGIILSRLFYIIKFPNTYFHNFQISSIPKLFYIWDKGLSGWGGIIGIFLALTYFAYKDKEEIQKWLDVISVSIIGAIGVINVGAFFDGKNYGNETSLPWGTVIENSMYAVPIHPVQLYASIYCLIITVILYKLFKRKISKTPGNISILALTSYSTCRFLEDFFRGDETSYLLGLREMQIYALLGIVVGIILIYFRFFEQQTGWFKKIKKITK